MARLKCVLLLIFACISHVICPDIVELNSSTSPKLHKIIDIGTSLPEDTKATIKLRERDFPNKRNLSLKRQYFKALKNVRINLFIDASLYLSNRSKWMNMMDDESNILEQYLNTPLGARATRLIRKASLVSYILPPLDILLKFIPQSILEIKTQVENYLKHFGNDAPNNTEILKTFSTVEKGRQKRLSESEGSQPEDIEIDARDEVIDDGSIIIDTPEVEEHELASYVFIPTSYMGCYRKSLPLSGQFSLVGVSTMSVDGCVYFCRDRRRTYAALHNGRNCICYSYLLRKDMTSENECNKECLSNNQQICGGLHSLSVFTTCNLYFYGFSCIQTCFCADGQCDFYTGICPSERCKENWKGVRCDRHAYLDVSLFMASWTGLVIYFFGCVFIIGFSWWTLIHMKILEVKI